MNLIDYIKEAKEGQAKKLKIALFSTIMKGVEISDYGTIFSTPKSDRIYVVTKPTWGKKSHLKGQLKVYKGFSGDTPINLIKAYSERVKKRYAKTHKANENT